jgi:hypothetical protein
MDEITEWKKGDFIYEPSELRELLIWMEGSDSRYILYKLAASVINRGEF